jgi:hypothetical protein
MAVARGIGPCDVIPVCSKRRSSAFLSRFDPRHGSMKRVAPVVDEGSVAIEHVLGPILTTIAQMTDYEAVTALLRKVPLFANLKDEDKVCIEETEEWQLAAGEMLVKEGEPAEHFFVLLEGEISLWKEHGDQEIVVARSRPGAFFGEVPLLLGTPYMLSGRAERDCRLIVSQRKRFGSCCGSTRRLRVRFSGHWRRAFATLRVQRDSKKSWRRSEQCPQASRMN